MRVILTGGGLKLGDTSSLHSSLSTMAPDNLDLHIKKSYHIREA